ncbi:MAG: hypothetical protein HON55_05255 [Legionellales bacterium]|nr:hypothetical protein [Legionellales bacterium]
MFCFGSNRETKKVVIRPHIIDGDGFDLLVTSCKPGSNDLVMEGFWSDADSSMADALPDLVRQYDLKRHSCAVVLPHNSYSHFTLNKPNIPHAEIRQSLPWVAQERLESMSYHTPALDSCLASELLEGKEHNKIHVFVTEESHVRSCVANVNASGLKVDMVTVHELAATSFISNWSQDALVAYVDMPSNEASSLILVLNGQFVAYKKLPTINLDATVDLQRDQFNLFWAEMARYINYYLGCLSQKYPLKFYMSGEAWQNLQQSGLFKNVFKEHFLSASYFGGVDLSDILDVKGIEPSILKVLQHDLLGGALMYEHD